MPPRIRTDPRYLEFAAAMHEIGDATRAYFVTHARCKSARQAKERGRALCQLPEIQLELQRLRAQTVDGIDKNVSSVSSIDAEKVDWENEVFRLAYSKVDLSKVPVKEKLAALRLLGESKGYVKKDAGQGNGIKATFSFRFSSNVPGADKLLVPGSIEHQRAIGLAPDTAGGTIVNSKPIGEADAPVAGGLEVAGRIAPSPTDFD